jgi:CYTH domain-containing protein
MIELEKTYLAKVLPKNLKNGKEMLDIYIPTNTRHPVLRIRKNGEKYEMTKKYPVKEGDASKQHEFTVPLTKEEFEELSSSLKGKRTHKIRYDYDYKGRTAEVDVFQDLLKGLVVVDFEFETEEDKDSFEMPDFCLVDVTQEEFLAGGMICGKSYEDVKERLDKLGYKRL